MTWYVNNGGGWLSANLGAPSNGWHHVATVASNAGLQIYVDGVLNGSSASSLTNLQNAPTAILDIGKDPRYDTPSGRVASQKIDELRIWNVARTQPQIAANMNIEVSPQAGLVAYYRFNQGVANGNNAGVTTALDESGAGRNGTLNNFALNGSTSNWVTGPGTINNQAPLADAGPDQSVDTNALVSLDGSGSSDPDGDTPLTYGWTQTGGPAVSLSDPTASQPSFTAPDDPAVLTFSLTVTDSLGLADATPDTVVVTVNNRAPIADAGSDQSVNTNALVSLNGTGSSDPDGDTPLTYGWVQTGGPAVSLSDPTASQPSFTAPGNPAVLTFSLTVTDSLGLVDSTPDTVVVTVNNQAPLADAGTDQSVNTNALVSLDGTGSSDPDNDLPLTYGWVQTGGPAVSLSDPAAASPTFTAPGSPAVLTFTLTVTDSFDLADPTPDVVVVTVTNNAPVANASTDQSVGVGVGVTLDGTGSSDPDNDTPLTYGWSQTGGPAVSLSSATASQPTFTAPGVSTVLTFTLTVTDSFGLADPTPDEVVVTVTNQAPSADAGSDQSVNSGVVVTLNGSGSSDPDNHLPLTYGWTQTGGPAVSLSSATAVSPTFTAPGSSAVLTFSLVVTDSFGLAAPAPDEVVVTVTNQAPVANAGTDQNAHVGSMVTLNGSNSSDPDNHLPLTYRWTQTGGPAVTLSSATVVSPTFSAPGVSAVLTFSLVVTDSFGLADPTPDGVVVTATNQAPVANAGSDQNVIAGGLVTLNSSGSSDPDNDVPLTYLWTQTGGPAVTLSSATAANPTFTAPSSTAALTFSLTVTDAFGLVDPTPDEAVVTIGVVNIYLPLILKDFSLAPDLVIDELGAGSGGVTVKIRNAGNIAVTDAFWVDVYFNPNQTPTLNKPWDTIAEAGAVWGVTGVTLAPGQSLTLTSGGAYYDPGESSASFPAGAQVYAYVDSINHNTSYGNVQESDESNNVFGPVVSTATADGGSPSTAGSEPSQEGLPER